ncbi:alkaline phosphatase D family protein [Allorhodopirellula solitaria]|uniref:Alkaline phosphatase D n=1 Tax=Allorhodopirellula solitaria TaxID=2527987 RepID=A0A5C5XV54_9BACT|nr:alkaline phosphatase D family protein [Allorhodopirellula solitaria]TWT67167.1 Alkaline phosphatase D precursor [Allorhodopirellula solitaria]
MVSRNEIENSLRYEGGRSRRWLLAYAASLSSIPLLGRTSWADSSPTFSNDPFTLGVASGDPDSSSVVLWTRLAPEPLTPDGGMPNQAVQVTWELATDESFQSIVASGVTSATPQLGHSVHVEVEGLLPDRWYWYRFHAGEATSPVGRTRTFPDAHVLPDQLNFAVTSCQNYEQGLYTGYEQMARDGVDVVYHLGDYIYEYEAGRNGKVRTHHGKEIQTLADYRIRHAQYRSDPLLHGMHAQCPWIVTWDDHETDNNYASDISEQEYVESADFLVRRANAYQAYYEMMPLRSSCLPRGPEMQLYRKSKFGKLADFLVLDTRQYRSDQPNGDRKSAINAEALANTQSMLGQTQRNWMYQQLIRSESKWNVLAQQVMMGMVDRNSGSKAGADTPNYSMDQWPGYSYERMQLMHFLAERKISNPVVLTGDIHSAWVNELRVDDRRDSDPIVATEFVATSLSSGGNGHEVPKHLDRLVANNQCVKYHNTARGYIRCRVTPETWHADYMITDEVLKPGGKTVAGASYVVESGNPAVHSA